MSTASGFTPFGSLREHLRGADPRANVLRSIDYVNAGGDATQRPEMRALFLEQEAAERELVKHPPVGRVDLTQSPGPVAERFLLSRDPVAVLVGPRGSAKTTTLFKKVIFEGQGLRPGPDGLRRYDAICVREKYTTAWDSTIPSWWKCFPADLGKWSGSKPHPGQHLLNFNDEFGPIEISNRFRAFGEAAESDDTLGWECTDCYINQFDTFKEQFFVWLAAVIGRNPPRQVLYGDKPDEWLYGRFICDMNAPSPLDWQYRDLYESPKAGYVAYIQPGGLEPDAENIHVVGRGYYHNLNRINDHRKWWTKINVDNKPGFRRDGDTPYMDYDDDVMYSRTPLEVYPEIPVLVGTDGGLTPAATYVQYAADGQLRVLAEVALQRGGMKELSEGMLTLEAQRFRDCEFLTRCDPSMTAGDDTADKSDRGLLASYLERQVEPARTNNLNDRHDAVKRKLIVRGGRPMLILDPSCKVLRRGFNGAYRYEPVRGTTDRGSIKKDFTTHVHDGLQAVALEDGQELARKRRTDLEKERRARRDRAREQGRFSPLKHAKRRQ